MSWTLKTLTVAMSRQCYFSRLMRSYPIFKLLDIYDRQSFIRLYVLDNVFVCILIYILFYAALWYANKVIKRIERTNNEMLLTVKENRTKLDDVIALKNKRAEYEEIVIKAKSAQRITAKHLDNEMKKLGNELVATENKMAELEKILGKCKSWENTYGSFNDGIIGSREGEPHEGTKIASNVFEDVKVLEPSFPPPLPKEPPRRKYGIFASRPANQRTVALLPSPKKSPQKIGFK
ncbi:uncharacterized protein LOC107274717 [Cephus cinctus]|uniref:Uncharacterized protein LOC107274717 n=1 Tax=Cephus cinctus TaxID=211228 RepID=A0AAJ7CGQ1_CEPCN|nr:uncharacterized protein LOC107274717 [Cephus cinctus]